MHKAHDCMKLMKLNWELQQVQNSQKDVFGPHTFKRIHKLIAHVVTSRRSESKIIGLVVLDKLIYYS